MKQNQRQADEKQDKSLDLAGSATIQQPSGPTTEEIEHLVALMTQCRYTGAETFAHEITDRFPTFGYSWKILGTSRLLQGRTMDSLLPMQKASELLPHDLDVHLNLGVILNDLCRLDEAVASYRRALALNPDFASGHNNLGNTLRNLHRLSEAEASFRRALEIKPDFAEAQINLGLTLYELDRLGEAEASYRRALEIKPDFSEAYSNLGLTLKDQGRLDEALVNYNLALKFKGDWKEALCRLTTPFILNTNMVLGSQYPVARCAEAHKQIPKLREGQEKHLQPVNSGIAKRQRIILIYPPPYQIPSDGEPVHVGMPFGPPGTNDIEINGDFRTITYGLLSIAAQAKRAGYNVSVYNLCTSPWRDVIKLITETKADVYGISAFTANRRGMGAVAELIRQFHPQAHITVGGPFVTALPLDTLRYYQDIDTAVIGEGENTFMDLLECLDAGRPVVGIPGTAWRNGEEVTMGPTRSRIINLDVLASQFDYFTSPIVMTSRGCPGRCSFCGSFNTWGKRLCFHSAEFTLDTFKKALARLPIPFLAIKDDTFTANRQRTIAICDAIIESKLNFLWSCDTRVDSLDDDLLYKMRLAGCQMISLGVESGSPEILKTMNKKTTPKMVLKATRAAQKYGMYVRYYMILLNRGETPETIQQSIALIKAGRPNDYDFSALSFYPGTEDWKILREKQGLTSDIFFRNDFMSLDVAKNRQKEFHHVKIQAQCDIGAISGFNYTIEERESVVERLPNMHSTYVDLANAYFRAGRYEEATAALNRAEELGFPINNLIANQHACINAARNDISGAVNLLERAHQNYPHHIVMKNLITLRAWDDAPVSSRGKQPLLNDSILAMDFSAHQLEPAYLMPL